MEDLRFLQDSIDSSLDSFFQINSKKSKNAKDDLIKIFIVEDDKTFAFALKRYLTKNFSYDVFVANSSFEYLNQLKMVPSESSICLLVDIALGNGDDGLNLVEKTAKLGFNHFSIAMTGFASIESAINATKKGALHYLTKPFTLDNLKNLIIEGLNKISANKKSINEKNIVDPAINLEAVKPKKSDDQNKDSAQVSFRGIIGKSNSMKEVFERIEKVALSESTVLITGESGTGKELVAKAIHDLSLRNKANLVSVNCGAIPSELLESELFGHVKGSFTGAISNRKGRFEMADKGSIFLDEIGDMPYLLQVKLLRVLQMRQIEPVGSDQTKDINVRIIAATHRNIEKLIEKGSFREDLFYRLNVIPINIPSLRERIEDIPILIDYFVNKFSSADKSNAIHFSDSAIQVMKSYHWPGNVRELENVIERLVILRGGHKILIEDLPIKIINNHKISGLQNIVSLPNDGIDLKNFLSQVEENLIHQALEKTKGNKNKASKLLSLNRTTLIEKIKKYDSFENLNT